MSTNADAITERFFSLFEGKAQKHIAEALFDGSEAKKKQPQISKWKHGKEPIPKDVLLRVIEKGFADSDWLLKGKKGPCKALADGDAGQKKSAPQKALSEMARKEVLSLCLDTQAAIGEFARSLLESDCHDPRKIQDLEESLQSVLRSLESSG